MTGEPPSIVEQAKRLGLHAEFYNFRRAKTNGTDFFNPALVEREDGLWLVARRSIAMDSFEFGKNDLMAFKLDANHLPQYGVPIQPPKLAEGEHFEDPRAFWHNSSWWISACNFVIYGNGGWSGAHQVLLEVDHNWIVTKRRDPVYGLNGTSVLKQKGNEKNWTWFSHENELHSIYMTQPHEVVRWDDTFRPIGDYHDNAWHPGWQFGQARGGSAPVRLGNEYFSFFHSSMDWRPSKRRYYMGAYAFEATPPFKITRVTPEPILVGSIDDPWWDGKPLVVFPCSAIESLKQACPPGTARWADRVWTVSLGINDLASARIEIPHSRLLEMLSSEISPIEPASGPSSAQIIYA